MTAKLWIVAVSSGLLATYGALLFAEGRLANSYMNALTFPFVDRPAAERANDDLGPGASTTDRAQAVERLLKANPSSATSWALSANADWIRNGYRITPDAEKALERSYDLSPYDHDAGPWRINFVLENWDSIPSALRRNAIKEANWIFQRDPTAAAQLKARLKTIRNPHGQTVARLELILAP